MQALESDLIAAMELRPEIIKLLHDRRYTRFLNLTEDVPWVRGECAWCTRPGRKGLKYCSTECRKDANIRASGQQVKAQVFRRDKGVCAICGMDCVWLQKEYRLIVREYKHDCELWKAWGIWQTNNYVFWEAHHIVSVNEGGGVCGLDNYQTLCLRCHKTIHKGLKYARGTI